MRWMINLLMANLICDGGYKDEEKRRKLLFGISLSLLLLVLFLDIFDFKHCFFY